MREDILLALEYHVLSEQQSVALLKSPSPLTDVFKDYLNRETDYMDELWSTITSRANAAVRDDFIKQRRENSDNER